MEIVGLFFLELLILFLLSRALQKKISLFFYTLSRSIKVTVYLLAILFLPGTVIHEVSHYLMAKFLFVTTGTMVLIPKLEGQSVKLGSVAIARSDPFRRLLIGLAPFLVGTIIIIFLLFLTEKNELWQTPWAIIFILYSLFEVGNTMFSSKKDLEGALFMGIFLIIVCGILYLLGVIPSLYQLQNLLNDNIIHIFYQGVLYLLIPLGLDLALIFVLGISLALLRRG